MKKINKRKYLQKQGTCTANLILQSQEIEKRLGFMIDQTDIFTVQESLKKGIAGTVENESPYFLSM